MGVDESEQAEAVGGVGRVDAAVVVANCATCYACPPRTCPRPAPGLPGPSSPARPSACKRLLPTRKAASYNSAGAS